MIGKRLDTRIQETLQDALYKKVYWRPFWKINALYWAVWKPLRVSLWSRLKKQ